MENNQQNEQQTAQNKFNNPGQEGSNNSVSDTATAESTNQNEDANIGQQNEGASDEDTDVTGSDFATGNDANQAAFTNDEAIDTDEDTDESDEDADSMRGQE